MRPWGFRGRVVLPERLVDDGLVVVAGAKIAYAGDYEPVWESQSAIAWHDGYVAPGYVDIHVHGGNGADFMDGTAEAFATVLAAHARHGTTSLTPTTTVASHHAILKVLQQAQQCMARDDLPARILGVHFYGPYFGKQAAGCHPKASLRDPLPEEYLEYLGYEGVVRSATIAPELPGAEAFARACRDRGIGIHVGHSHATFDQVAAAIGWGARHVDHLYCAMSDRARLRQEQAYPMRGGVLEATLYFDELTTEIIADGKHLSPELMRLALKIKGPERLALVSDCSRALDQPDGAYVFGPKEEGVRFRRQDGVGVTLEGTALASSVAGMDQMVRTLVQNDICTIAEAVRMASLTPATIVGYSRTLGSLEAGKAADLLLLDHLLVPQHVWVAGRQIV